MTALRVSFWVLNTPSRGAFIAMRVPDKAFQPNQAIGANVEWLPREDRRQMATHFGLF
jgi:hypothetical protein